MPRAPFVDDEFDISPGGAAATPLAAVAEAVAKAAAEAGAAASGAAVAAATDAAAAAAAAAAAPPAPAPGLLGALSRVPQTVWLVLAGVLYYLVNLYYNQNALLYHPTVPGLPFKRPSDNPAPYNSPAGFGLAHEEVFLRAADGVRLHAWLVHADADASRAARLPTVLFFHANAGNVGFRLPLAKALVDAVRCNVFMLEYRGYGASDGTPSEEGLALDARAAVEWARERGARGALDARKLFLFGQSLGGAVAVRCASELPAEQLAGVILENTFTSIGDMVDKLMPVVAPLKRWLQRITWDSDARIGAVEAPLLFIGGQKDELVHPAMMRRLHDLAVRAVERTFVPVPDGTHNDSWLKGGESLLRAVRAFMERALKRRGLEFGDAGWPARAPAPAPAGGAAAQPQAPPAARPRAPARGKYDVRDPEMPELRDEM